MPKTAKQARPKKRRTQPALSEQDFRAYLLHQAARIAPEDVESLVAREQEALKKSDHDWNGRERPQRQLELAIALLKDHVAHHSPQIPYYTVALLAAAVLYFLDPFDAVPDWIQGSGTSDDAIVLELACELGAAGIQRYCTSKGLATKSFLGAPVRSHQARATTRRSR
jgi:uncharacterized membrane protein YkvA (DUF1232 family)